MINLSHHTQIIILQRKAKVFVLIVITVLNQQFRDRELGALSLTFQLQLGKQKLVMDSMLKILIAPKEVRVVDDNHSTNTKGETIKNMP